MTVIALDIGGTKIKGALIDKNLKVIKSLRVPSFATKGKSTVLKQIELVIESLLPKKKKVYAIGIAFPGFDDAKGKLLFTGNALSSFLGFNLTSHIQNKFNIPTIVENDANCFTLAESYFGAGADANITLGIIWGSGVGSGLVIKKQHSIHQVSEKKSSHPILYSGSTGGAMELGHIPLLMENGKTKTLEQLIGGAFLVRKHKVSNVTELYLKDKKAIKDVFKRFAQGLAIAINMTNPDVVVIGGGVSKLPASAFKEILALTKKYALPSHMKHLKIKKYAISDDAGLLGAAIIALKMKL